MKNLPNSTFKYMIPAALILLSGACSVRQYLPAPGVATENRFAIVRSDSLLIAIRPQSYPGNYQELNNRFFPIFIRIKNNSSTKQQIDRNNFSILAEGKQFDFIPPEYILANLRQSNLLQNYENPFALVENDTYPNTTDKQQEIYYEVLNNSFSFGDLLPSGLKEGFLFYNRAISNQDTFTIDVNGQAIQFIK